MEATILKIDPEHLRFKKMPMAKKSKLRRENIKALIRSKPAGTPIQIVEFQRVTMTSNPATYSMLMNMVKKGQIQKIAVEGKVNRYSWAVNEKIKVTRKAAPKAPVSATSFDTETLIEKAKSYAWETNDDSLRAFIKWLSK